jgi:hypothetical protein
VPPGLYSRCDGAHSPAAGGLAGIGHWVEGNKPALLSNPAHVFVAPVWMMRKVFGIGQKKSN